MPMRGWLGTGGARQCTGGVADGVNRKLDGRNSQTGLVSTV